MELAEAYRLFKLGPDAGQDAARRVYNNLRSNILDHLHDPGTGQAQKASMEVALTQFDAAIATILADNSEARRAPSNAADVEAYQESGHNQQPPPDSDPSALPEDSISGLPENNETVIFQAKPDLSKNGLQEHEDQQTLILAPSRSAAGSKAGRKQILTAARFAARLIPARLLNSAKDLLAKPQFRTKVFAVGAITIMIFAGLIFNGIIADKTTKAVRETPEEKSPVSEPISSPKPGIESSSVQKLKPAPASSAEDKVDVSLLETERWLTRVEKEILRLEADGLPGWPTTSEMRARFFTKRDASITDTAQRELFSADLAIAAGDYKLSGELLKSAYSSLSTVNVMTLESLPTKDASVEELYESALAAIADQQLTIPFEGSALDYVEQIEKIDETAPEASKIRQEIVDEYLDLGHRALQASRLKSARNYAERGLSIDEDSAGITSLLRRIDERKIVLESTLFEPGISVVEYGDISMVTLQQGGFTLGASLIELRWHSGLFRSTEVSSEIFRPGKEHPPVEVEISKPFAISQTEVTVRRFREFVLRTGYKTDAERRGESVVYFGDQEVVLPHRNWRHDYLGNSADESQPVLYVSHQDALKFVKWLSRVTGAKYRLPTEVEFEYAARAGSDGFLPWNSGLPPSGSGNFRGKDDPLPNHWGKVAGSSWVKPISGWSDGYFGPAPVGSFNASSFNLKDMVGNVSEWTQDCYSTDDENWNSSHITLPGVDCGFHIVRGANWASDARDLRVTRRVGRPSDYSSNRIGFRVVREIH